MRLDIVDVFAEAPLEGNQLAVVHDAGALSTGQMQSIAREMNFSETTFVLERAADRARVRIFTPGNELPFAGHPTLGTAWVLGRDKPNFTLDLNVGPVEVSFGDDGVCWMTPPDPNIGAALASRDAAELVNVAEADLAPAYPSQLIEIGPEFVLIAVRDESVLASTSLNASVRARLLGAGTPAKSIFVFCEAAAEQPFDFAARMYFDAGGIREDPATGSANSAFAVYLRDCCGKAPGQYVVAQGDYMLRPSRIYLDIAESSYRVGGRVQPVVEGELRA